MRTRPKNSRNRLWLVVRFVVTEEEEEDAEEDDEEEEEEVIPLEEELSAEVTVDVSIWEAPLVTWP